MGRFFRPEFDPLQVRVNPTQPVSLKPYSVIPISHNSRTQFGPPAAAADGATAKVQATT
ncbi:hypothetical protein KFK09_009765 [Dendrobium nobile]|uniref:Uncharacterized protein n=1 Tax=Dendrobium nobile TaxID=94219 RepID=A0A8T3BKX1_DENNO|nr:hypothetical protein KFK09_009765 [Dendrobium nobile]